MSRWKLREGRLFDQCHIANKYKAKIHTYICLTTEPSSPPTVNQRLQESNATVCGTEMAGREGQKEVAKLGLAEGQTDLSPQGSKENKEQFLLRTDTAKGRNTEPGACVSCPVDQNFNSNILQESICNHMVEMVDCLGPQISQWDLGWPDLTVSPLASLYNRDYNYNEIPSVCNGEGIQ